MDRRLNYTTFQLSEQNFEAHNVAGHAIYPVGELVLWRTTFYKARIQQKGMSLDKSNCMFK